MCISSWRQLPKRGFRARWNYGDEAHRRYTAFFNARARMTGHLFQGRFASVAMDEVHLLNALR